MNFNYKNKLFSIPYKFGFDLLNDLYMFTDR